MADMPFTFKGDRGGKAEDADLLAELRAISAKSAGGMSRFDSDDNDDDNGGMDNSPA